MTSWGQPAPLRPLPPTFIPATGGSFTSQGSGGADVGAFMATTILPNTQWTWTNPSAALTVTRSSGLTVTWSGGASNSYVQITGTWTPASVAGAAAPNASGAPAGALSSFSCAVPTSAGQFTAPSYVLEALPAGIVSVSVSNENNYTPLGATGADWGSFQVQTVLGVGSTFK